jgi:hypothetical protein
MSHGKVTHEQGAAALPGIGCVRTEASTTIPLRIRLPDKSRGRTVRSALYRPVAENPGLPAHALGSGIGCAGKRSFAMWRGKATVW